MKLSFFGYGKTTRAIAEKLGGRCTFYDDNCTEPYLDEHKNNILPSAAFDPEKSDLEILTPSIPPHHPLLEKAKNPVSEYDYILSPESFDASLTAMQHGEDGAMAIAPYKPFTIWVSGTNGKTTTTQMLTHLLGHRGAVNGGNIGVPLAELDPAAAIWVLESSSFTLHHTRAASPDIYLLLPITPDHLNWHGTAEAYAADKLKPLLTMREGELALIPKGLEAPQTDAYVVEYDSDTFLCAYFNLDSTKLDYKGAFLQDALLSLAITRVLFDETDYGLLNTFQRDAHRQEEFHDKQNRLWVNDSKATNLDATIQAVRGYADQPIHLILGGDDKGVDLSPLFKEMKALDLTLYTIGANSEKLLQLSKHYQIDAIASHTLENAVKNISSVLDTKSVALLSPAAASFDQFKSYKHRGETFMDLIKNCKYF